MDKQWRFSEPTVLIAPRRAPHQKSFRHRRRSNDEFIICFSTKSTYSGNRGNASNIAVLPPIHGGVIGQRGKWMKKGSVVLAIELVKQADDVNKIGSILHHDFDHLTNSELGEILLKQQDHLKAWEVFKWLDTNNRLAGAASSDIYAGIVRSLGKRNEWSLMDRALKVMESFVALEGSEERQWCVRVYEHGIHAAMSARNSEVATDLVDRMAAVGVNPGKEMFTGLMKGLYNFNDPARMLPLAERVMVQMNTFSIREVVAFNCMLQMYVKAGEPTKAVSLLKEMEQLDVGMDMYTLHAALQAFGLDGNVAAAQGLLQWLFDHPYLNPTIHTYRIMLGIYGRSQHTKEAFALLEDMEAQGLKGDLSFYNSLLFYLGRSRMIAEALSLYLQLKSTGPTPDVKTYRHLLMACAQAKKVKSALAILQDMRALKISPDEAVFDAAARVCGQCIHVGEEVDSILRLLREEWRWRPTALQMKVLMAAYRKENPLPRQVFTACKEMVDSGVVLDGSTWASLIGYHFFRGQLTEMLSAVEAMEASGTKAGQGILCMVMDLQGTHGNLEEAERIFLRMKEEGYTIDLVSCNTLMNAYTESSRADKAFQLVEEMREAGIQPDIKTWTLLIKTQGRVSNHSGAVQSYRQMLKARCPLDEIAYNTVINVCGRHLPLDEVVQCYQSMVSQGYPPNSRTQNLLLSLLTKGDRLSEAENIFKRLERSRRSDAVSYCTMVDAYGKRGELEMMEECLEAARANTDVKRQLSASMYNAAIDAYANAAMLNKMEGVMHKMMADSIAPNNITFNTMIYAYGSRAMIAEMEDVLRVQEGAAIKKDLWTYNILIGAYGGAQMPYASVKVFREMQDSGLSPDKYTYTNLIKAFRASGDYLEAARWSLWMQQAGYIDASETHNQFSDA